MKQNVDMLHGSLADKILLYALPLAATGILEQLFNAADIAVVGNFVGKEAMAAVGSNTAIIGLLVNLFMGVSLGTNVVIAHAVGRKDKSQIHRAVHTSIIFALVSGVCLTMIGEIFAPMILKMTSVPADVFDMSVLYLRVYLLGIPVILLYNFESAIFRGQGNTRTPLLALAGSGVINVLLNLFFVVVLKRTVDGVAMATVLSNLLSSIFLFFRLLHSKEDVRIRLEEFHLDKDVLKRVLQIGVPSGIQGAMFAIANIIIQSAINSLGATVMAASSAAFNLEIFAFYVMNSFGQTCTTFTGQNYGAGNLPRCRKTFFRCLLLGVLFTAIAVAVILGFGHQLLAIFNKNEKVVEVGYVRLLYIFFAYIFSIQYEIGSGYLRGFGISFLPALISLVSVCGVRIFWIMTIFSKYPTFTTIMIVYPVSLGLSGIAVMLTIIFMKPSKRMSKKNAEGSAVS